MTDTRKDLPPINSANFLARVREVLQVYLGSQGSTLDRGLTVRDIVSSGLASLNPNGGADTLLIAGAQSGGSTGGSGSTGAYEPDLTIPPKPTGFSAAAGLTAITVQCDSPTYGAGHGHGVSRLYGATRATGAPAPTFSSAVELAQFQGTVFSYATGPGKTWHLWLIWESKDGVSSDPEGGTNGVSVTTGKVGNSDLNDAIIEARNLATGAITAGNFSPSIEPVTMVSALPASKQTSTIFNTADGKLYRWNGTAYVSSIPTSDLSGTVSGAQIAANAITAGNLAAGSVTASKMYVSGAGAAINADPWCTDSTAWDGPPQMLTGLTDAPFGATAMANFVGSNCSAGSIGYIPVESNKRYRIEGWVKQAAGTGGALYLGVIWYSANKTVLNSNVAQPSGAGSPAGWNNGTYSYFLATSSAPSAWTRYMTTFGPNEACAIPSNARYMRIVALMNNNSTAGVQHAVTGFKLMEKADADLIVDGSIIASKLAANAIAVGTAAVQNGAIVNAMIGAAQIDDAKVANLSAAKLTAGDGTIGGDLKSSNFVAGSAGWRVRPDGSAEFSFAHIRGTLLASQVAAGSITATMIDSRGLTIKDAGGTVIFGSGTNLDVSRVSGLGAFATLGQINGTNVSTYIAAAAIGNAQIGGVIQSDNYSAGVSGWQINKTGGTAEFGAASIRGQLTASQIDTRGLTIKDAGGTVIFGSGTPLSVSNISGLGSLATQSSVAAGDVSGLGAFANLNQIDSSNVSTYIAGAAIKYAQIGDSEVGTLKIAGNAVTVPVSAEYAHALDGGATRLSAGWVTGTSSADFGGSAVLVSGTVAVFCVSVTGAQGGNARLRIFRDGAVIRDIIVGSLVPTQYQTDTFSFDCIDYPGGGSHSYQIGVDHSSSSYRNYWGFSSATITAMGVKR